MHTSIEVDADTADLLEACAASRDMPVADLLAAWARADRTLPKDLRAICDDSARPWSPGALAEWLRLLAVFRSLSAQERPAERGDFRPRVPRRLN